MRITREHVTVRPGVQTTRYWLTHAGRKVGPYVNIHEAGAAARRVEAAMQKRKVVA
jgi:hypothetical protein